MEKSLNCLKIVVEKIFTKLARRNGGRMATNFEQLKSELPSFKALSLRGGENGFLGQEAIRFYSIAGTLFDVPDFSLDENSNTGERQITHILSRSLLENYFWIIYIFDDQAKTAGRYEEFKNSFKKDYFKLLNEPLLPRKNELEPADPAWAILPHTPDVKSMLAQIRNVHGNRLDYLYFVYRVASFDTHGRNLATVLEASFGRPANFPVLKIGYAFDLISNQYLVVLNDLRSRGII